MPIQVVPSCETPHSSLAPVSGEKRLTVAFRLVNGQGSCLKSVICLLTLVSVGRQVAVRSLTAVAPTSSRRDSRCTRENDCTGCDLAVQMPEASICVTANGPVGRHLPIAEVRVGPTALATTRHHAASRESSQAMLDAGSLVSAVLKAETHFIFSVAIAVQASLIAESPPIEGRETGPRL